MFPPPLRLMDRILNHLPDPKDLLQVLQRFLLRSDLQILMTTTLYLSFKSSNNEGPNGSLPSAEASKAIGFKPSTDQRRWSRTGLALEYQPRKMEGEENYSCPFPLCDFTPRQKFDAVVTHIRHHLNIAIQCHYCNRLFWSCAGWTKHCSSTHNNLT